MNTHSEGALKKMEKNGTNVSRHRDKITYIAFKCKRHVKEINNANKVTIIITYQYWSRL